MHQLQRYRQGPLRMYYIVCLDPIMQASLQLYETQQEDAYFKMAWIQDSNFKQVGFRIQIWAYRALQIHSQSVRKQPHFFSIVAEMDSISVIVLKNCCQQLFVAGCQKAMYTYCRVPMGGGGLRKAVLAPGRDETQAVKGVVIIYKPLKMKNMDQHYTCFTKAG